MDMVIIRDHPINALRAISYFAVTLMIYLGIPLLGWGLDDLPGFFAAKPRSGYAVAILLFGIAIGIQAAIAPIGIRGSDGIRKKLLSRQRIIRIVVTVLLYLALFLLTFMDRREIAIMPGTELTRWIGLVLFITGMVLVVLSGITLNRFYSKDVTVQVDHKLITSGVYCYIRHPRYLGGILSSAGLCLLYRSWVGLIGMAAFILLIFIRIHDEERLMRQEFGSQWESYCSKSWKLLPFIF